MNGPVFDEQFFAKFTDLIVWRRDVRRFKRDPIPEALIDELLDLMHLSPSVGNSQPWRWVRVEKAETRRAVRANFEHCNKDALESYMGPQAKLYAELKLQGLEAAPLQFAVFCEEECPQGYGLGRATMPEALTYSVTSAITTFWLAARARGVGVGWLSIIDPIEIKKLLCVSHSWRLVGYLCVGWPEEDHDDPELVRHGWQDRASIGRRVIRA